MEIKNGALGYTLTLDNKQVQQILAQTRADFARTNEYVASEMDKVQSKMSSIAVLGGSFLSIAAAKGFVTELIHVRGEFQQIENAIETITGSQDKMNSLMTEWKDLTLRSPFRLSEIAQSGKQLLAYGVEVEKVTDDIEMLGNIASGVSAPINDIAYLYGTLKTQGRAYQQDINQFTGRGIPIIKELAKQFGVAESEVRAMTEAGKIGFPEVEKALRAMTSEGGQFFNLIGKQATTLTGAVNRLKHEFELMFNEIGTDTEGLLSGGINVVTHLVENYKEIGETLKSLVLTYGVYKAAVIAVSTFENVRSKTVSAEIANLSRKDRLEYRLLERALNQAQANLNLAQTELANGQAVLTTMRAEVSALAVKKQKAIASAIEAKNNVIELQTKLANARAELAAIEMTGTARQVSIAQKRVEKLENAVIGAQEKESITRKAALGQTQVFNNAQLQLENQAKKTNIAQTAVANAQEGVSVVTKNLNSKATARLTLLQHAQVLSVQAATKAQALLNATMLNNPAVLLTIGFATFAAILYKTITALDATEKAQQKVIEAEGEAQKSIAAEKLELERLIEIAKDETKSKEDREAAIKKLNEISPKYLGQLDLENINTKLATDAVRNYTKALYENAKAKALQSSYEGLVAKEQDVWTDFYKNSSNPDLMQRGSNAFWKVFGVETKEIKNELDLRNQIINLYGKEAVKNTKTYESYVNKYLKSIGYDDLVSIREQRDIIGENLKGMSTDLEKKTKKDAEIQNKSTTQNKAYWEKVKKENSDARDALGDNAKGSKEWTRLTKEIDNANKKIELYNDSYKKNKSPKKSDDPVEIFKKQVQGMKDEYDRYVNYMNTDDIVLKATAEFKFLSVKKQGANYEEYLRNVQKQLANVTNKTKVQVKELQYVNDELSKIIDYNAFDKYKEGINEQVDSSENLLKAIGLLQEEKQKFANSSNQNDKDKFKFLDEKEIDVIKKTDDAAKSLIKTLTEEANPLDTINKKFDQEIELLKYKLEKAKTDIEKESIKVNIEQVEKKRTEALKDTPTNNAEVNEILKKYQTLEQKRQKIVDDSNEEIKKIETKMFKEVDSDKITSYTTTINEIKAKQKEALQAVDSEILKKSKGWIQIFGDYSNKSGVQLRKILDQIRTELNNPKSMLNEQDKKAYQDQFKGIKEKLEKDNPFDALISSFDVFKDNLKKGFKDIDGSVNLDSIRGLINDAQGALNETLNIAEDLGINVSDSTRDAVELGANLFEAGTQIAEGIATNNPVQAVQGILKAVTSIFKANDKKKQRQIKRYQQAVDDLARSFKNLQYETSKALGSDTYKDQRAMLDNLTQQQNEYRKMIKTEQSRKKTDQGKIKEWQQAIIEIDQAKQDLLESLAQDVLQTNAKDLASTLGDALVEAFGKGEDAAKSFEKVANDVLKDAIVNQLKKKFLEDQLQTALDQLYKDMGADNQGNFNFDGLTPAEQQKFKDAIKQISQNFSGALEMYSDLFKDLETDPNQDSLSGAIRGMSEQEGNIMSGHLNATRILTKDILDTIKEANKQRDLSSKILMQQLDRLANIDNNTRVIEPLLTKLINRLDNAGRAYGF
ncbi:tape measure protein [Chishuiella sp.]|uniref:tape measure protein n=1 Tax=Chishuiella sp. TaxID=1969467 RepID=UPI0028B208A6|nr:tape measure protein [Chishuiella sp.]